YLSSSDAGRVGLAATIFHDLALEDPHLHTNGAERGLRSGGRVVDVGAERVQRHTTLVIPFHARDLGAAKTAAAFDLDAACTHAHGALHRTLHRATERDTLRQ